MSPGRIDRDQIVERDAELFQRVGVETHRHPTAATSCTATPSGMFGKVSFWIGSSSCAASLRSNGAAGLGFDNRQPRLGRNQRRRPAARLQHGRRLRIEPRPY